MPNLNQSHNVGVKFSYSPGSQKQKRPSTWSLSGNYNYGLQKQNNMLNAVANVGIVKNKQVQPTFSVNANYNKSKNSNNEEWYNNTEQYNNQGVDNAQNGYNNNQYNNSSKYEQGGKTGNNKEMKARDIYKQKVPKKQNAAGEMDPIKKENESILSKSIKSLYGLLQSGANKLRETFGVTAEIGKQETLSLSNPMVGQGEFKRIITSYPDQNIKPDTVYIDELTNYPLDGPVNYVYKNNNDGKEAFNGFRNIQEEEFRPAETYENKDILVRRTNSGYKEVSSPLMVKRHKINPGETLSQVSNLYNVPVDELMRINNIKDETKVPSGMLLKVYE